MGAEGFGAALLRTVEGWLPTAGPLTGGSPAPLAAASPSDSAADSPASEVDSDVEGVEGMRRVPLPSPASLAVQPPTPAWLREAGDLLWHGPSPREAAADAGAAPNPNNTPMPTHPADDADIATDADADAAAVGGALGGGAFAAPVPAAGVSVPRTPLVKSGARSGEENGQEGGEEGGEGDGRGRTLERSPRSAFSVPEGKRQVRHVQKRLMRVLHADASAMRRQLETIRATSEALNAMGQGGGS